MIDSVRSFHSSILDSSSDIFVWNDSFVYDDGVMVSLRKAALFRFSKLVSLAIALILVGSLSFACSSGKPVSFKIGILLPLTGPDSMETREVLDWAVENFNAGGGIRGIPVELMYKDTHNRDILALGQEFAEDPSIQIVIGPQKSSEVHILAPLFINSRKLLISPMATAGDILRAYGGKEFIWRTCQSDIAQIRSILYELAGRDVTRISLIYSEDSYGKTFLEWTGFFCTELGIDLLNRVNCNPSADFEAILEEALVGSPDYILTAAYAAEAVELKKLLDSRDTDTRLFLTDAAETPYLLEQLGKASEGIELISPAANPDSGFEEAYLDEYGYYPWDYAAPTYDAFLLAVYTLARQESRRGITSLFNRESIEESFQKVISGTGIDIKWDDSKRAVDLILKGELPDVNGSSGPLRFDKDLGVDPTESFYSLNRVETRDGITDFRTIRRFSSRESAGVGLLEEGVSAASTRASWNFFELDETGNEAVFLPKLEREKLQAVIISLSSGWDDYRHQSDALAVYSLLKRRGVEDDDIILFSVDDVPWLAENPRKGDIRHELNGENLRENAVIDYSGETVNLHNLRNVLLGNRSETTPVVLESDEKTNVFVYIVGHGMPGVLEFHNGNQLTSRELSRLVNEMYSDGKYRQMLIMVEACYGESLAMYLETPGVAFLTGSSRIEASFGAIYDHKIRQWLADDFTAHSIKAMEQPGITLKDLYLTVYSRVSGSHVRLVNYENFGSLKTPLSCFTEP